MANTICDMSTCSMWNYGGFQDPNHNYLAVGDNGSVQVDSAFLGKDERFIILSDDDQTEIFYIQSYDRLTFLTVDEYGKVTCDSKNRGTNQKFQFSLRTNLRRWAIKSDAFGTYLVNVYGKVLASETEAEDPEETWLFHLGCHPQVNLRSVKRGRYATLDVESEDCVKVVRKAPWGEEAIFTLELDSSGFYHIKTANDMYIHPEGRLVRSQSDDTALVLCVRGVWCCGLLFCTKSGHFLSAKSTDHSLIQVTPSVATDEKFAIEDSCPQVFFTAQTGKMITVEEDGTVKATMDEEIVSVREVFRLRFEEDLGQWMILSYGGCLSIDGDGRLENVSIKYGQSSLFRLEYTDAGFVNIVGSNEKYMSESNGTLTFDKKKPPSKDLFIMTIINKSQLLLRCDVGYADFDDVTMVCNNTSSKYSVIKLEHTWGTSPYYNLKGPNDQYVRVAKDNSLVSDSSSPTKFYLELVNPYRLAVKAPNGKYLKATGNGSVTASVKNIKSCTHWEF